MYTCIITGQSQQETNTDQNVHQQRQDGTHTDQQTGML